MKLFFKSAIIAVAAVAVSCGGSKESSDSSSGDSESPKVNTEKAEDGTSNSDGKIKRIIDLINARDSTNYYSAGRSLSLQRAEFDDKNKVVIVNIGNWRLGNEADSSPYVIASDFLRDDTSGLAELILENSFAMAMTINNEQDGSSVRKFFRPSELDELLGEIEPDGEIEFEEWEAPEEPQQTPENSPSPRVKAGREQSQRVTEIQIVDDVIDDEREHSPEVVHEEATPVYDDNQVFTAVDQMPTFPGGDAELMKYIASHVRYPDVAVENGVQGRVVVQFVVQKDGSIGEVKVVSSKDPDLDREALRVVRTLPKFTPGRLNGQPVNVYYTLPITFKLS